MELNTQKNKELIIGGNKELSFSIDDSNSVIFNILRDKMYSNKIGAICREVASNSRDANREAGLGDVPIEIQFTKPENLFSIGDTCIIFRDYGIGINPDRMENVFMKYAASTKRNSNAQTGGFGLGAKTPFAYTDSFIIKTVCDLDGVRMSYVWNAIIDQTGKGKMILLDESPSDAKSTGTEIVVPIVNQSDRSTFERECYYSTCFWKNVKYIGFQSSKKEYDFVCEEENFSIIKNGNFNTTYVGLIDGIPYNISPKLRPKGIGENYTILLNLEVGSVSINANRESIQHDADTITYLDAKVLEVETYFTDMLTEYLTAHNSYKEAVKKYTGLKSRMFRNQSENFIEEIIYYLKNNYSFSNGGYVHYLISDPYFKVEFEGEEVKNKLELKAHIAKYISVTDYDFEGDKLTNAKTEYKNASDILIIADSKVYLMDKGRPSIIKNYHIHAETKSGVKNVILYPIKDATQDAIDSDKELFGLLDVNPINYSDIVVKVQREVKKPEKNDFIKLHTKSDYYSGYSTIMYFNKTDKKLYYSKTDKPIDYKVVFLLTPSITWCSNLGREGDAKRQVMNFLSPGTRILYITESKFELHLRGSGYQTFSQYYDSLDKTNLGKYLEYRNSQNVIDNIHPILLENFEKILPKSVVNIKKVREELTTDIPNLANVHISSSIQWEALGVKNTIFDYEGLKKAFKRKMKLNYPMILPFLENIGDISDDNKKRRTIEEISKYIKNK